MFDLPASCALCAGGLIIHFACIKGFYYTRAAVNNTFSTAIIFKGSFHPKWISQQFLASLGNLGCKIFVLFYGAVHLQQSLQGDLTVPVWFVIYFMEKEGKGRSGDWVWNSQNSSVPCVNGQGCDCFGCYAKTNDHKLLRPLFAGNICDVLYSSSIFKGTKSGSLISSHQWICKPYLAKCHPDTYNEVCVWYSFLLPDCVLNVHCGPIPNK